jgi:hypothetical protein
MLLVLIPIVWLAFLTLLASLCRVAADGDGLRAPRRDHVPSSIGERLVLSPAAHARPVQSRRGPRRQPALSRTRRSRRPTHTVS